MSIAGIVLAAGFSRRMGRPKQDLQLCGKTLLERAIHTAASADLSPLIVVLREPSSPHSASQPGVVEVVNGEAEEGMASSVRAGIAALNASEIKGAVILTCDQPLLQPEHLRALAADPAQIVGSAYAGRVGVPAYFPVSAFAALLSLRGDAGARSLLQGALSIPNEDLALDIDTEEDIHRAEQRFA